MYFEIYSKGKLIKRGNEVLNDISFSNELMSTPQLSITLPIDYIDYIDGRENFKLFVNNKCFWGIVKAISINKEDETIDITIVHHIDEWNNRQVSMNNAVADKKLNVIYDASTKNGVSKKNIKHKVLLTANKVFLKYSDWKNKTKKEVEAFIKKEADAKAYNFETKQKLRKPELVETDIKFEELKNCDKDEKIEDHCPKVIRVGTYTAIYKYEVDGDEIKLKVPISVSYKGKNEKNKKNTKVLWEVESIDDEIDKILSDSNFIYSDWEISFDGTGEDYTGDIDISYVFSKQSKYEALTQAVELTDNLFWRVNFDNDKLVEIGQFGEVKPYVISTARKSERNIQLLSEPTIDYVFDNVVNVATVTSEKSDSGASTLTLRDLYNMQNKPKLQAKYSDIWVKLKKKLDNFPIVIIRDANYTNVNNERNYNVGVGGDYSADIFAEQSPIVAPNTSREYAIIDKRSVALESGEVIEGSFDFNDIAPVTEIFNKETQKLTNKQRIKAQFMAYRAAIKSLKQSRRRFEINITVSELPSDVNVGDRVRFVYNNSIFKLDKCSNYMKKIMTYDNLFYITKIDYNIDGNGTETNDITLSKELVIDRVSKW